MAGGAEEYTVGSADVSDYQANNRALDFNQDTGAETVSASDEDRLTPGSFSLRHGFPEWFSRPSRLFSRGDGANEDGDFADTGFSPMNAEAMPPSEEMQRPSSWQPPHILVMLYYLRASLSSTDFLDSIPLEAAANSSAWHAWRTFSSKAAGRSSSLRNKSDAAMTPVASLKQQPGGARSPGEWNWDGVWEDRVRKCIQASISEQAIYKKTGAADDLIRFLDLDQETLNSITGWRTESSPPLNKEPASAS
ncbi:hypothetical protein C1H76_6421 [Elsinoe australis]|uniref:Uncharacterized protein n=1 Tax=Elsinoe australis TaxID=40998 RepID=A0A4U7B215_9PEZI|nr:hypothetical protein C1H76_6421 [Elsinoe australis]